MKTAVTKRAVTLMLALLMLVSIIPMMSLTAFAASAWPSFSSSGYCEMVSPGKISVYRDTGLTTPGTCNPAKSYNAYVSANDKVYILKVTENYTQLSYPTSSGRRIGYVKTSTLFGVKTPTETVTCRSKVTTYIGASTTNKSGNTAVGDVVVKLGTTKTGFVLVMYTAKSGSRSMKAAFVTTADYEKIKGNSGSSDNTNTTVSAVRARLDAIGNGSLRYDKDTVMKIGAKFTGTRSGEQCKGYAKNVFYLCFGITPGSTQSRDKGLNYLLNSTSGMTKLGSVTNMTNTNISALFANARPGDFVQMRRSHGGSHSAIVYSVTSSGVTFLEANTDNKNTVTLRTYSWADLCNKNVAMSVYTATNYKLK